MRGSALTFALLFLTPPLHAQAPKVGIGDYWKTGSTLGDRYSDFNTQLIQVQTVKSIPFFNMDYGQRASAVRGYYQAIRQGNLRTAATTLKNDFSNGAILHDIAIASLTQVMTQMAQGKSLQDSVSSTARYMTSAEYMVGNLMGGTLGAALGTMIPVPVVGGLIGRLIVQVPTMTGAMLGSNIGAKAVHGFKEGKVDMGEILRSIDWLNLFFQSVGATAGMMAGGGLGIPILGTVVGGVVGGNLGLSAARWVKSKLGISTSDHDYLDVPDYLPPVPPSLPPPAPSGGSTAGIPTGATAAQAAQARAYESFLAAQRTGDIGLAKRALGEYQRLSTLLGGFKTGALSP